MTYQYKLRTIGRFGSPQWEPDDLTTYSVRYGPEVTRAKNCMLYKINISIRAGSDIVDLDAPCSASKMPGKIVNSTEEILQHLRAQKLSMPDFRPLLSDWPLAPLERDDEKVAQLKAHVYSQQERYLNIFVINYS